MKKLVNCLFLLVFTIFSGNLLSQECFFLDSLEQIILKAEFEKEIICYKQDSLSGKWTNKGNISYQAADPYRVQLFCKKLRLEKCIEALPDLLDLLSHNDSVLTHFFSTACNVGVHPIQDFTVLYQNSYCLNETITFLNFLKDGRSNDYMYRYYKNQSLYILNKNKYHEFADSIVTYSKIAEIPMLCFNAHGGTCSSGKLILENSIEFLPIIRSDISNYDESSSIEEMDYFIKVILKLIKACNDLELKKEILNKSNMINQFAFKTKQNSSTQDSIFHHPYFIRDLFKLSGGNKELENQGYAIFIDRILENLTPANDKYLDHNRSFKNSSVHSFLNYPFWIFENEFKKDDNLGLVFNDLLSKKLLESTNQTEYLKQFVLDYLSDSSFEILLDSLCVKSSSKNLVKYLRKKRKNQ